MIERFLPLVGMIFFIVIGFLGRVWLQYHRYGQLGIILFRSSVWRHRLRDILFLLLFLLMTLQTVILAIKPKLLAEVYIAALPAWTLWLSALGIFGGLLLMVAAQIGMGASWRMGIDEKTKPGLVTSGLYRFCRNPIYLGGLIFMSGLTVSLPTWFSLEILLSVYFCIRYQVYEEEKYLIKTYGNSYRYYIARTGRFLPKLGRR